MNELSPQMLRLLDVTRVSDGPNARDRERLRARLGPMLAAGSALAATTGAAGALAAIAPGTTATTAGTGTVATVTAGAATAGTAGAVATTSVASTLAAAAPAAIAKASMGQLLLWTALGVGVGTAGLTATVVRDQPPALTAPAPIVVKSTPSPGQGHGGPARHLGASPAMDPENAARTGASAPASKELGRFSGEGAAAPVPAGTSDSISNSTSRALGGGAQRDGTPPRGAERPVPQNRASSIEQTVLPDPGPRTRVSTLADETRLLRAAQTAQRRGDETKALELLREHARRFPDGLLRVERGVAEVLSLCAQGRTDASNRLREQILQQAPGVPAVGRIHTPCKATSE